MAWNRPITYTTVLVHRRRQTTQKWSRPLVSRQNQLSLVDSLTGVRSHSRLTFSWKVRTLGRLTFNWRKKTHVSTTFQVNFSDTRMSVDETRNCTKTSRMRDQLWRGRSRRNRCGVSAISRDTGTQQCKHTRTQTMQLKGKRYLDVGWGTQPRQHTVRYDTLYLRAPKSWRLASLICLTEPNKKE